MGFIDNIQQLREDEYDNVVRAGSLSESGGRETSVDEREIEYAPGTDDTYDPIRTYLAALGAVPLLKREQEVALAKQIERGEKMVMTAVSRSPVGIEALLRVAEELRNGARPIKNVVQIGGETPSAEKTELKHTLQAIAEVSRLYSLAIRRSRRLKRSASWRRRTWPLARLRVRASLLMNSIKFTPFERARLIALTRAALVESAARPKGVARRPGSAPRAPNHLLSVSEEKRLLQRMRKGEAIEENAKKQMTEDNLRLVVHMKKVRELMKIAQEPLSLETRIGTDGESHLGDFIEDKQAASPSEAVIDRNLKEHAIDMLNDLTPREAKVIRMRFGLEDGDEHTLEEVGRCLGVTRERTRQIEAQALQTLRQTPRTRRLLSYLRRSA